MKRVVTLPQIPLPPSIGRPYALVVALQSSGVSSLSTFAHASSMRFTPTSPTLSNVKGMLSIGSPLVSTEIPSSMMAEEEVMVTFPSSEALTDGLLFGLYVGASAVNVLPVVL